MPRSTNISKTLGLDDAAKIVASELRVDQEREGTLRIRATVVMRSKRRTRSNENGGPFGGVQTT